MKKTIVIVVAALAACVVLYFVNAVVGNPVSYLLAKHGAEKYVEAEYGDIDVYIQRVSYNIKSPGYFAIIDSHTSPDTHFTVYLSMLGKVKHDNYGSMTEGWNTYNRLEEQYRTAVDGAFLAAGFDKKTDICYGGLELNEKGYSDYKPHAYGYTLSELKFDGTYSVQELGEKAGHIVIYLYEDEVTFETAAVKMLFVKEILDKAEIPFCAMDFVLQLPREALDAGAEEQVIHVSNFMYSDIYAEGMEERVRQAHEDLERYYAEQDAKGEKQWQE